MAIRIRFAVGTGLGLAIGIAGKPVSNTRLRGTGTPRAVPCYALSAPVR